MAGSIKKKQESRSTRNANKRSKYQCSFISPQHHCSLNSFFILADFFTSFCSFPSFFFFFIFSYTSLNLHLHIPYTSLPYFYQLKNVRKINAKLKNVKGKVRLHGLRSARGHPCAGAHVRLHF